MSAVIEAPPAELSDTPALYDYLLRLSDELSFLLGSISKTAQATKTSGEASVSAAAAEEGRQSLLAVITKTAAAVYKRIDEIREELKLEFTEKSDFGSFRENIDTLILKTAENTISNYNYESILSSSEILGKLQEFKANSESYIKTGILYYENGLPVTGVAVGEIKAALSEDGVQSVSRENLLATFTPTKLCFWDKGRQVAYISNSRLFITNASVLDNLYLGSFVFDTTALGLEIRWEE